METAPMEKNQWVGNLSVRNPTETLSSTPLFHR